MGLTGLACEVNDMCSQQQEAPLIGNPRFLKRGGCQKSMLFALNRFITLTAITFKTGIC